MYCSLVSKQNGEDPIGTAALHERYLFVETPFPWEKKVETSKHFPDGLTDVIARFEEEGTKCRVFAFLSNDSRSKEGMRRIMFFKKPAGPFKTYEKKEYVIAEEKLNTLVEAWLAENDLAAFQAFEEATDERDDVFVCTHGSRDQCCGKFGYPIYEAIKNNYADHVRVWRCSHIGSHRLAPTLIIMPEARYWGHVSEDILDTLILRRGDVKTLRNYYRGWGGVNQWAQAAERELFIEKGWDWLTYDVEAAVVKEEGMTATVQMVAIKNGTTETYEADIDASKTVRAEGCTLEPKEIKQFEVTRLEKVN